MAQFAVGQSITTTTPTVDVDAGLAVGSHRFQLVVVDSAGLRSVAEVGVVAVQRSIVAGPVVTPVITGPVVQPVGPGPVVTPATPVTPVRPATNPVVRPRKPKKPSA